MPGDVDVLSVLAEQCHTDDPIGLLQRLEEAGLTVSASGTYDPVAHGAAIQEFSQTMEPIWVQGKATRERLITDGWSEEMAEHLASHSVHILLQVIATAVDEQAQEAFGGGEQDG